MFTNIQYQSLSHSKDNIDVCNVKEHCAWVLDGADALFPTHVSDRVSDGDWFVKELNQYLKKNLQASKESIADTMRKALIHIHEEFLEFPNAKELYDLQMPNACCAIVRLMEDKLSYFVLGNCEIILTDDTGQTRTLSDLRLQEMDAKLLEISQDARKKQRMPLFRAKNFMEQMLVENRLRRNMDDGYYVLSEDETVVDHAYYGELTIQGIKNIALICNGFSSYFNCRKVMNNLDDYLNNTRNAELVCIYNDMLSKRVANTKLAKYMQAKLSGQSTMVYFEVVE